MRKIFYSLFLSAIGLSALQAANMQTTSLILRENALLPIGTPQMSPHLLPQTATIKDIDNLYDNPPVHLRDFPDNHTIFQENLGLSVPRILAILSNSIKPEMAKEIGIRIDVFYQLQDCTNRESYPAKYSISAADGVQSVTYTTIFDQKRSMTITFDPTRRKDTLEVATIPNSGQDPLPLGKEKLRLFTYVLKGQGLVAYKYINGHKDPVPYTIPSACVPTERPRIVNANEDKDPLKIEVRSKEGKVIRIDLSEDHQHIKLTALTLAEAYDQAHKNGINNAYWRFKEDQIVEGKINPGQPPSSSPLPLPQGFSRIMVDVPSSMPLNEPFLVTCDSGKTIGTVIQNNKSIAAPTPDAPPTITLTTIVDNTAASANNNATLTSSSSTPSIASTTGAAILDAPSPADAERKSIATPAPDAPPTLKTASIVDTSISSNKVSNASTQTSYWSYARAAPAAIGSAVWRFLSYPVRSWRSSSSSK